MSLYACLVINLHCRTLVFAALLPVALFTSLSYAEDPVTTTPGECHSHAGWQSSDSDRIPDIIETDADTDGDGIPNYLDEDSDNDGTLDILEHAFVTLLNEDVNQDGIDDAYQNLFDNPVSSSNDPEGDGVLNSLLPRDTDFDGIPNYLDEDKDNDGVLDKDEGFHNGNLTAPDTDSDFLSDGDEVALGTQLDIRDSDGGGVWDGMEVWLGTDPTVSGDDYLAGGDADADNDGIPNTVEGTADTDNDRVPDMYDLDSDNDGWFDIREAGLPDVDDNGLVDDPADLNGNGIADSVEGLILDLPDSDNDGQKDLHDLDADNDGVKDTFEIVAFHRFWAAGVDPFDIDADGLINTIDLDTDGDGITDLVEAGLDPAMVDVDGNGMLDSMQDLDLDGIPDGSDISFQNASYDSDGDGIIDEHDIDQNGSYVGGSNYAGTPVLYWSGEEDKDEDGIIDQFDADNYDDGLSDQHLFINLSKSDLDGDGLIQLVDADDSVPSTAPIVPIGVYTHTTYRELPEIQQNLAPAVAVLRPVETYNPCVTDPLEPVASPQPNEPIGPSAGNSVSLPQTQIEPDPISETTDNSQNNVPANTSAPSTPVVIPEPTDEVAAAEPAAGAAVQQSTMANQATGGGGGSVSWLMLLGLSIAGRRKRLPAVK